MNKMALIKRKTIPPYCVFFSWYINNECNYKCSYCKPQVIKTVLVDVNIWIDIWQEIYCRYGSCHIHISGGEPFLYPNFIKLITRLSEKHTLEFSTNLSIDIKPFVENINFSRARIGCSLHPEFANFNEFIDKINLLKIKGFDVWTNYVAYPPILRVMDEFKKTVEAMGIRFSILPFNGEYAGRNYPLGYTEDENNLLAGTGGLDDVNKKTFDWRTDAKRSSTKGQICRMGQMYARIYPDAEVYRCCGNGSIKLGNMLDRTFNLLEEALPCDCDNCPCWKCMLLNKEEHWMNYWTNPGRLNLKEKI